MSGSAADKEADYPPSWDRIYPRCPVCRSEQYALAVLAFSAGEHGCWSCHHVIRKDARLSASGHVVKTALASLILILTVTVGAVWHQDCVDQLGPVEACELR